MESSDFLHFQVISMKLEDMGLSFSRTDVRKNFFTRRVINITQASNYCNGPKYNKTIYKCTYYILYI